MIDLFENCKYDKDDPLYEIAEKQSEYNEINKHVLDYLKMKFIKNELTIATIERMQESIDLLSERLDIIEKSLNEEKTGLFN
jgi:hypothetical protein